jgi:glutamine synthetase
MLMAGLKGIEEGYELPEPMELNLYGLTDKERKAKQIQALPNSLEEAIIYMENSDLVRETLENHSFERFISLKENECNEYRVQVTEYEINKYYPIL